MYCVNCCYSYLLYDHHENLFFSEVFCYLKHGLKDFDDVCADYEEVE